MATKRQVQYYNERLLGSMDRESCNYLERIIQMKAEAKPIEGLRHTIYNLSDEEIHRIRSTGQVDASISKEKGTLSDAQTLGVGYMMYSGNCILGDSVGLGKTVQIASLMNIQRKKAHDANSDFRYLYLTEKTIVDQAVNKLIQFTRKNVHELTGEKKANEQWRQDNPDGHLGGIVAPHSIVKQQVFHSWLDDVLPEDELEDHYYFDYLIIDEGSIFGNTATQMYKFALKLRRYCKRIIILNATPFESKLDIFYSQLNFLDSTLLPTMTDFRKNFYVYQYNHFGKYPEFKEYKNAEVFRKQIGYFYFYHTRKELGAEMKNTHFELKQRPMSDAQKNLMELTDMYGFVYDCPTILDPEISFDEGNVPKLEMMFEVLDEYMDYSEQLLIFCEYKEAQKYLKEWLMELGYTVEILNGNITNRNERNRIVNSFVNKEYNVLITSVQKGLDFGDVKNLVFYSFSSNPNKMIQMEGRVTRSFNIENKNIFILAMEGRELKNLRKTVRGTLKSSHEFSSSDLSGVVELLLNTMS